MFAAHFCFLASDKTDGSEQSSILNQCTEAFLICYHSRGTAETATTTTTTRAKKQNKKTHNLCSPTCRLIGLSGSQDKLCRLLSLSSVNLLVSVCEPETESSARQHAAAVICLTILVYAVGVRGLTGDAQNSSSLLSCMLTANLTT